MQANEQSVFLEQFEVHTKIKGEVLSFSIHPLPLHIDCFSHYTPPPHRSDTFLLSDETILTHHHPKSIVYIMVHSVGFEKGVMICICRENIMQGVFAVLKIYSWSVYPFLPRPQHSWPPLILFTVLTFFRMSRSGNHTVGSLFHFGFFHLLICT